MLREVIMNNFLEENRERIERAFHAISFDPEKRAQFIIESFLPEYQEFPEDAKEKYEQLFWNWINATGRCMSSMITGPANFPVERNRKAFNSEQKRYEEFRNFVEKVINPKIKNTVLCPEDDLEQQMEKHRNLVQRHAELKAGDHESYQLTNNRANIKRTEERILILKSRIDNKEQFEKIKFNGGEIDIIDDRVCIIHDEKPEQEIINRLKSNGFHWSPRNKYWCRKHTANALYAAKEIIK